MNDPAKILLVDDDDLILEATRLTLEAAGYEVSTAASGAEGLRLAAAAPPDLALLDRVLPDMDGVEVCRRLKADPATARVFVALVSGVKTSGDDRADGLETGADDYIVRPISNRELLARVQAMLRIKQAEEKIRYQADLLAHVSDAVISTDLDFVIRTWNRAAESMYGWPESEVIGKRVGEVLRTEYLNSDREQVLQQFKAAGLWKGEVIQKHKDGTPIHILAAVSFICDGAGNPTGVVAVNRDISERKLAEGKIRESEETYRNLFQNAQVGLFRTRISDGKIIESNEQLARMFGYDSREEFIAEYVTSQNYVDPGTRERMLREIQANGTVQNFEARFYRKDGSIFWVQYSAKIYPEKGWIEGVAEDITARKEAEEQLRAAHAELQRLLAEAEHARRTLLSVIEDQKHAEEALRENNRRLGVLNHLGLALAQTLDLPTIYHIAYEHIAQLVDCPVFGISRYDPVTQTLRADYMLEEGELLDPTRFPPLPVGPDLPLKGRVRAILTRQPEIVSAMPTPPSAGAIIVGRTDDEHIARSALYAPIVVQGQTTGLLELQSYRDNAYDEAAVALLGPVANQIGLAIENARLFAALEAERNSLAQRVRERTAQLEAANRELEAFSYSVSHDLRAPLRALDGFSAALLSQYTGQLDEQGRHYLERIQASAQRMNDLINDLLDLSRVTRHEMTRQPVDLSALAREIAAELQAQAPQRQAEFVIAEGLAAYGDVTLLRLMLENLLGNAWKFTATREQAVIEFGAGERDIGIQGNKDIRGTYFVRDNGVGFDMAYANKLFAPFQRLHSQSEFPGTGIGLATVQRIIARHGGRVWAEAEVDRGATFYFTLLPDPKGLGDL